MELIKKIDQTINSLYCEDTKWYKEISVVLEEIKNVYEEFIKLIPKLNNIGMDIKIEGVVTQLTELMSGITNLDKIQIYDSLKYEIKNTILFYDEILTIMNE